MSPRSPVPQPQLCPSHPSLATAIASSQVSRSGGRSGSPEAARSLMIPGKGNGVPKSSAGGRMGVGAGVWIGANGMKGAGSVDSQPLHRGGSEQSCCDPALRAWCMCMCVVVCVHKCMCACARMCSCVYVYVCMCARICMSMCIACMCMCARIYVHVCAHVHGCACACVPLCKRVPHVCVCVHSCACGCMGVHMRG